MGYAYRGDETRAVAVGDLILVALDHRWGVVFLADRGCRGSQGETAGQRGAAFRNSLRPGRFEPMGLSFADEGTRKSLPRVESIRPSTHFVRQTTYASTQPSFTHRRRASRRGDASGTMAHRPGGGSSLPKASGSLTIWKSSCRRNCRPALTRIARERGTDAEAVAREAIERLVDYDDCSCARSRRG